MGKIKLLIMLMLASLMIGGISSCSSDDDTNQELENPTPEAPTETVYVDIDYILSCSEDLLQYVTPQVTYTDENGTVKTMDIPVSEWKENKEVEFNVTFPDVTFNAKVMTWTKRVRYSNFPVDKEMSVKYVPKADMPIYDKTKVNKFYHYAYMTMHYVSEKNNNKHSVDGGTATHHEGYTFKNVSLEDIISEYVDDLCIPYIMQTNNYSCVIVGADNKTVTDIVSGYSDRQGMVVKDDGTYSMKYEEEPYVAPKPYCDVTYTLNCSEEMLKFSTPQVCYVGNDGKLVTFQLSEADFEINDKVNKWAEHYHGDEEKTYNAGDENAKIMKWTKHVHYDDISVVDDEMTVTYIPKDNVGDMRLSHAYHNLSVAFLLRDDKGSVTRGASENKINSNVVEGEWKTWWNYIYLNHNGNPVYLNFTIDSFIGNQSFSFIDTDGIRKTKTVSELIFNTYKDYQGIRLESNGIHALK